MRYATYVAYLVCYEKISFCFLGFLFKFCKHLYFKHFYNNLLSVEKCMQLFTTKSTSPIDVAPSEYIK